MISKSFRMAVLLACVCFLNLTQIKAQESLSEDQVKTIGLRTMGADAEYRIPNPQQRIAPERQQRSRTRREMRRAPETQRRIQPRRKTEAEMAIEATVLGYIQNFFENNTKEMLQYLDPKLAKRGLDRSRKSSEIQLKDMSMKALKALLKKNKPLALQDQKHRIQILDIFYNTASVKLETGYPGKMEWIEYIHLYKIDNEWKIINIIWDYFPPNSSTKSKRIRTRPQRTPKRD